MNIILDQSLKTDSKQPKVFELGQITTTLQDLLDNSKIVINGEQTIILSVIDENDNVLKYLLPLDYKGESFYGLGQNILESDLISLGSLETRPYKVYTALLTQTGTNAPVATVLENTVATVITWSYQSVGNYIGTASSSVFTANKRASKHYLNFAGHLNSYVFSDTQLVVNTYNTGYTGLNGLLLNTLIEIIVYD